jgi:manganese/zinc/iron transport system substrate-binding protein
VINKNYVIIFLLLLGYIGFFVFDSLASKKKSLILCSTSMIADTAKILIGEYADVIAIMGPGIDPHLYKASSHDAYNIQNAHVIFYNGLHLEGKMAEIFSQIERQGRNIFAISDGLDREDFIQTEYDGLYDPHIWHDVILWKKTVRFMAYWLIEIYPQYAEAIKKNEAAYQLELDFLHDWIMTELSKIVYCNILISSHDAFSYFARRYGLEFYSVQGISTDAEATVADTEKILDIVLKNYVPTVFVEHTVSENYLKNIQSIMSLKGKKLRLGDRLYSDALGEEEGKTYIEMMKKNVQAIVKGLSI